MAGAQSLSFPLNRVPNSRNSDCPRRHAAATLPLPLPDLPPVSPRPGPCRPPDTPDSCRTLSSCHLARTEHQPRTRSRDVLQPPREDDHRNDLRSAQLLELTLPAASLLVCCSALLGYAGSMETAATAGYVRCTFTGPGSGSPKDCHAVPPTLPTPNLLAVDCASQPSPPPSPVPTAARPILASPSRLSRSPDEFWAAPDHWRVTTPARS